MFNLASLPKPAARRLAIRVKPAAERQLRKGHPWLFDGGIDSVNQEGKPGDLAVIFDGKRRFLAIGLFDPTSPIRVRILQHNQQAQIDDAWFAERLGAAFALRQPLILDPNVTGIRLVHGENDGLPGLVVDLYESVLVVRLDTAAWVPYLERLVPLLVDVWVPDSITLRFSRRLLNQPEFLHGLTDGELIYGRLPEGKIFFKENGFRLEVDPVRGQKTGYFLDQRDNRAFVETLARGKDVLDVFTYHGGFALHAARGGARSIMTIDQSQPAIAVAQRNFRRNEQETGRPPAAFETLVGDAFKTLAMLARSGREFNMVILDPPSFAQRQADVAGAVQAYRRLVTAGLGVLAPAGILVAASCSSRLPAAQFFNLVTETVARTTPHYNILRESEHALDHPITFNEGAYLKCIVIQR